MPRGRKGFTIVRVLSVESTGLSKEVILVDDGSTDGSAALAAEIATREDCIGKNLCAETAAAYT